MEMSVRVGPLPRDFSIPRTVRFSFLSQPQLILEGGGLLALPVDLVHGLVDWVALPLLSWLAVQPRTPLLRLAKLCDTSHMQWCNMLIYWTC